MALCYVSSHIVDAGTMVDGGPSVVTSDAGMHYRTNSRTLSFLYTLWYLLPTSTEGVLRSKYSNTFYCLIYVSPIILRYSSNWSTKILYSGVNTTVLSNLKNDTDYSTRVLEK